MYWEKAAFLSLLAFVWSCGGYRETVRRDIEVSMHTAQGPIGNCYKTILAQHPGLGGRMVVSFLAEPRNGRLNDVKIYWSEIQDAELKQCVIERVSALRISHPPLEKSTVYYPLIFSPK